MYSPSRQTFHLAQGVATDQTLFNFSFSASKQTYNDTTATAKATATAAVTAAGTGTGAHDDIIPQLLNRSSEMLVSEGKGQIPSYGRLVEGDIAKEEESTRYHVDIDADEDVGDISVCSATASRAVVWSTESELALSNSNSNSNSNSGIGSPALTLRAKANKMQSALYAQHAAPGSEELSSTDGTLNKSNVKSSNSNAQPAGKKAARFVWLEVGMTNAPTASKSHSSSQSSNHSSSQSSMNPDLVRIDSHQGAVRTGDVESSSSVMSIVDDAESVEEVQAENLPENVPEAADVTPTSTHDDTVPSQHEDSIHLTEGRSEEKEEEDAVTALTTPLLWHFNPDEVLQRFSNSNSNINSNCVRTVELDSLSSPRSSSVESSVLSSSGMSKAVSPGSALDASVTASQEVEGVEMTVKEAERMLSRVLKKNVREIIFMTNEWYHFYL